MGLHRGFWVADWRVEPATGELVSENRSLRIRPRCMDLLVYLAERAGAVCDRDTLLREVWRSTVSDEPLSRSISDLRAALGDSGAEQRVIKTVPKRGYALIAPVRSLSDAAVSEAPARPGAEPEQLASEGFKVLRPMVGTPWQQRYLALDEALGRRVEVKTLPAALRDQANARARLVRAAAVAARITDPVVAVIYQVARFPDGAPYVVQSHVPGASLLKILDLEAPLPFDRARRLALDLSGAVTAVHDAGIWLRSVDPDAFVEDRTGRLLLTDFCYALGDDQLSAEDARLTAKGELVGNPRYMSPEQLRGEAVDERSDVYGLGVLLYELFEGRYPYAEVDHPANQMDQHLSGERRPLAILASTAPSLASVIERALERAPGRRPSIKQIERVLQGA